LASVLRGHHNARVIASHLDGEAHFTSNRFKVLPALCAGDHDYWRALAEYWDSGRTLVNVEHDIDVTDGHIAELLDCPHSLCSWAYECHFATTGKPQSIVAAGTGDWAHHLQGGEEWADWSAIGLVKLTPQARTGELVGLPWGQLEKAVHKAVARPWHMHWPLVAHHHW
jgi:hypothetical protein